MRPIRIRHGRDIVPQCLRLLMWIAASAAATICGAHAQEPVWGIRIGSGVLVSSHTSATLDSNTRVRLGKGNPVVSVDVIRALDCCLEIFMSAAVPTLSVALERPPGVIVQPPGSAIDSNAPLQAE
jgi:hypothetical protein